ncbi:hypothetical protein FSP39_005816 [Pinctada imbricata]|uniref:Uncharacterized protein n=1 Tax=Pinctada imbricata TaxID=66713 RepID=A0AA89C0M4_PINIB|nr:hypothetical protein FSP39_005816 [Pinctada imbricata]
MRAKKNHTKITKEGREKQTELRRSSRLRTLSVDQRTKLKIPQANMIKGKVQKRLRLQHVSESIIKRDKGSPTPLVSTERKQTKQVSKAKTSKKIEVENTSKQLARTRNRKRIKEQVHVSCRTTPLSLKRKPKRLNAEHSNKVKKTKQKGSTGPVPYKNENENRKPQLIKTITIEHNNDDDARSTRYSDVAFLDDNHILALDDYFDDYLNRTGQRICCISLVGTLVCDLLVPGYPWSVVVLSPTEAVVTMRGNGSNGLLWISIDVHKKSMEITRNIPFKAETFGLAYSDRSETFIVSYSDRSYMSILNKEGKEIRKIPCKKGVHYRCLILENNSILFLDHLKHTVSIMNEKGKVLSSLNHSLIKEPNSLEYDCFGNIYVGNYRSGNLLKFDKTGRHLWTFEGPPHLCAIGFDRTSDRMAVASNNSIFIYMLYKND